MRRLVRHASLAVILSLAVPLHSQQPTAWKDPSPHSTQFITVGSDVRLEVLDWGGAGRSIVLLAGLGNTAHVFDDFAPKLTSSYHVYGITRRGFGFSSAPDSGYSADQLGDDVLAVMTALKLDKPVLVGHSLAGEELSSVATRHPEQVAGLVYLDAIAPYSYFDPSEGDVTVDLLALHKKLGLWLTDLKLPERQQYVQDLLQQELPRFEKELRGWQQEIETRSLRPTPPPSRNPSDSDTANFAAFQSWFARVAGGKPFPEAELRQSYETRKDGGVGARRDYKVAASAILAGQQKYTTLTVPILAIFAVPHGFASTYYNDEVGRKAAEALDAAHAEPHIKSFETNVPSARVVRLAEASHYLFLSNEQDVLREMRQFVQKLQ
jgi:non-heme chloroperoxidase